MNERIQELLIEAHKQTNGGIYNGHISEWTEKFAELIVKECIIVMMKNDYHGEWLGEKLKQHFGVKE